MNNNKIINVSTPTNNQDCANKQYVDSSFASLNYYNYCDYATDSDIPCTYDNGSSGIGATITASAPGSLSVDGVTVAILDRILVRQQSD